jgi:hypothetical protein
MCSILEHAPLDHDLVPLPRLLQPPAWRTRVLGASRPLCELLRAAALRYTRAGRHMQCVRSS